MLSLERGLDFEKSRFRRKKKSRDDLRSILGRFGPPRGVKMSAAEGQKRSYVEMILSSEVEVKLR